MMHLKLLEKQEQSNPQNSQWAEIIKIRSRVNETNLDQNKSTANQ
jgi:hypothetical protein